MKNQQTVMAQAFASASAGSLPPKKHRYVHWNDAEWTAMARAMIRLFPDLGLPAPDALARVTRRHVEAAMLEALQPERHRNLSALAVTVLRPHLTRACRNLAAAMPPPVPQLTKIGAPPASIVYRQPDGPENGSGSGHKIFWTDAEWYKIAVELAYIEPSYLETLNRLNIGDVFRAQRVLPSIRRRPRLGLHGTKTRAHLLPVFTRLRADIAAARVEQANARLAAQATADAKAEAAQAEEAARQAIQQAARDTEHEAAISEAEATTAALAGASTAALFDALASRLMTSAQGMIENAIISALSSDRVRKALVVNLYVEQGDHAPAAGQPASRAPSVKSDTPVTVARLPVVAIVGALQQQAAEIRDSFPQLKVKGIDKNLTSGELKAAVQNADLIIGMTHFLSHSMDAACYKAGGERGERYKRVDGGISAVRRVLSAWLATTGREVTAA